MNWLPEAVRDGIIVVLVISGPLVIAAAAIGLVIGILQAATQVQEQTIGSALKIIGVFALIIFAGFWMFQYLNQYTSRTISTAFILVPRQTQKVIPKHLKEEEINKIFQEKIKAEPIEKPLNVTPPEEIQTNLPHGGVIPGQNYLGAPDIVKPPAITKILPPQPPAPPIKTFKPDIPLAPIQEPKTIKIQPPEIEQNKPPENPKENIDSLEINLVPGEPQKINPHDLWQREEVFSNNATDEAPSETTSEEIEGKPTWLE